jgi:hypothetical protein
MFLTRILQSYERICRQFSVLISILSQALPYIALQKCHYQHCKHFRNSCNILKCFNFSLKMAQKF